MIVTFWVVPGASKTKVSGWHQKRSSGQDPLPPIKVQVAAPPVDGAANEEFLRFLKKALKPLKIRPLLVRGQASREKVVQFEGLKSVTDLVNALGLPPVEKG